MNSKKNNIMSNRMNYTENTEDEIDSLDEEEENKLYMNKKELIHLEDDKSLDLGKIDEDYSMTSKNNVFKETSSRAPIMNVISPSQKQAKRNTNELMKFISDSSEYYRNSATKFMNKQNSLNNTSDNLGNISGIMQPINVKIHDPYLYDNNYYIESFDLCYYGKMISSFNSFGSAPSFGVNSQQFETNKKYKELEKDYNNALALVQYWQKFYLDIVELIGIKGNSDDYFSEQFKFSVIENVKNLIKQARDKMFKIFNISHVSNFIIWGERNDDEIRRLLKENYMLQENIIDFQIKSKNTPKINKKEEIILKVNSLPNFEIIGKESMINKANNILRKKYFEKNESIDSLPPMKYIQKKSEGMNTEPQNIELIREAFSFQTEPLTIKKSNNFDETKLSIESIFSPKDLCYIPPLKKPSQKISPKSKVQTKLTFSSLSKNANVSSYQYIPKKKIIIHKIAECQTDLTEKNIDTLELLSKECSNQLSITQKDKENMQKLYEDKIKTLSQTIDENKELITKLTKDGLNQSKTSSAPPTLLLPEMIPPEQTYKIFIHCVKHFKYEEELYKKFMEEADIKSLKSFVIKMEKYIVGTSMPLKKSEVPKKAKIAMGNNNNNIIINNKRNNNILTGIKPFRSNYEKSGNHANYNSSNGFTEKRTNSTFSKYKAAISNYKKFINY